MPELPHLFFPGKTVRRRQRPAGPRKSRLHVPSRVEQSARLEPRFAALESAVVRLQQSPDGAAAEEVLVIEVIGEVADFARAAKAAGLDLLMAVDEGVEPDGLFYNKSEAKGKEDEPLKSVLEGRLYLTASNARALGQVRSLWKRWKKTGDVPRGYGPWKEAFSRLRDIRPWDARDRMAETGIIENWTFRVQHTQGMIPVEIELFYASTQNKRKAREARVRALVKDGGGGVLQVCEIPEIQYHALLAELPVERVEMVLEHASQANAIADALIQEAGVQYFRPSGQAATPILDIERSVPDPGRAGDLPAGDPVVALLDGLPLQNHVRLDGRLIVDDPDGLEDDYPAGERQHGTAMASLIVWGDIAAQEPPISRPLYVRPVMHPHHDGNPIGKRVEQVSGLIVDLIHRAVRRMFAGEGEAAPTAPTVRVVNLSIGEEDRPFMGSMSPLARLLDWLAHQYNVLFIVSAGNVSENPELDHALTGYAGDQNVDPQRLESAILANAFRDQRNRRILAPAEALNVLSVGAHDHDHSPGTTVPRHVLALQTPGMPSIYSRMGPGYRRSVKPEILHSGGRVALAYPMGTGSTLWRRYSQRAFPPGHLVASPGAQGAGLDQALYMYGTSDAAALVSRAAAQLYDVVLALRAGPEGGSLGQVSDALILKALLVHSALWPTSAVARVQSILKSEGLAAAKKDLVRLFGFGIVDPGVSRASDNHRITLVGSGKISRDDVDAWEFPLPPSLAAKAGRRRLSVTLAWLTPPPITRSEQRGVKLVFAPRDVAWVSGQRQADSNDTKRGTVHHEVFEGDKVTAFAAGSAVGLDVQCDDRELEAREEPISVPYVLLGTLEVAPELGVPVYNEVRVAVNARVRVRA